MCKPPLVTILSLALGLTLFAGVGARSAHAQAAVQTIGEVTPLPGQISELFVDDGRRLIYAANFTAGRVEVLSMDTRQRIGSFVTTPRNAAATGMAVSPDGRWMIVTSKPVTLGVLQLSDVTVINLNDPTDRRIHPVGEEPLAVSFGIDNRALMVTTNSWFLVDPEDGSMEKIFSTDSVANSSVQFPVSPPQFTRDMSEVSMASSGDYRWIFGITDEVLFSYQVRQPVGSMWIRRKQGGSDDPFVGGGLVNEPTFDQVSASLDGSYFMAGELLLTSDLRVIAQSPEASETNPDLIGGTGIDQGISTVYGSFATDDPSDTNPLLGELLVMDADNLYVRRRFRVTERIVGRIVPTDNGRVLYAVSDSGMMTLPIGEIEKFPILEVNPADRAMLFAFDFCNQQPITHTMRLESPPGGKPASFSLTTEHFRTSGRPAVLFEPAKGVTPAVVRVTVNPGLVGPVQGTSVIPIMIETDAVNIPKQAVAVANKRDVDQKGEFIQIPGNMVGVVGDPIRDRFYVLDQENFQVLIFDSKERRQIGALRTGNTPTWMTVDRGGNHLVVANSMGENVTLIDLRGPRVLGPQFLPWQTFQEGHYPVSVTWSNQSVVIASRTPGSPAIDFLNLPSRAVSTTDFLGLFNNSFGSDLAVAAHPDGDEVMVADSNGNTYLWENTSGRLIVTRQDFSGLGGAIGAAGNFYVADNHVMNRSLVPLGDYDDGASNQQSSGFAVLPDGIGVRTIRPISQVDTGALQKIDPRSPSQLVNGVRMVEPPPERSADYPFSNTLGALRDGSLVSTTSAGIAFFPKGYDSFLTVPRITAVSNGADFTRLVGSGGLISIFGENLAAEEAGAVDAPLPTKLGDTCVTANGLPTPLLFVSPNQINAQMPYNSSGPVNVQVHSERGISDLFVQQVDNEAPAIFGVSGPSSERFVAIFRENNTLATASNPLRKDEMAVIYMTGLGQVTPLAVAGNPASMTILTTALDPPAVSFGGVTAEVFFAGLTPGYVGLYQVNVKVPGGSPLGLEVPLSITQSSNLTTVNVRVID